MNILNHLILIYSNQAEKTFLNHLSEFYNGLFHFELLSETDIEGDNNTPFLGFKKFLHHSNCLLFSFEDNESFITARSPENWTFEYIKDLNHHLFEFNNKITNDLLKYFPNDLIFQDKNGNQICKHCPNTLFPDLESIDEWLISELIHSNDGQKHFLEADDSFDRIMMQSYYLLKDDSNEVNGYAYQKQDIKPILKSYLDETAQALVGWSDVVSGASIKNDEF